MQRAQWFGLVCGVVALLAVGGWILADDDEGERGHDGEHGVPALEILEVLVADLISPADAVAKASEAAGAEQAVEISLDMHEQNGRRLVAWEVEFVKNGNMIEVLIDAKTGALIERDEEKDEDEAEEYLELLGAGSRSLKSVLVNLDKTVHGQVFAAQIEEDDDLAVWEVLVVHRGDAGEVEINAKTGKILPEGDEDGDDEDDEDDHDDDEDEDDDD